MYSIASVDDIRRQANRNAETNNNDIIELDDTDQLNQLLVFGRKATELVEQETQAFFMPVLGTERFSFRDPALYTDYLENAVNLNRPMVELTAVAIGSTTETLSNYRLIRDYDIQGGHGMAVQKLASAGNWYRSNADSEIQITGYWAYHKSYSAAWLPSLDTVQDNPLTATATTINVTDSDGLSAIGLTPRFSGGQLLRIEDEYCIVVSVDYTGNTLTVFRGQNGTTAVEHAQGTSIEVFYPDTNAINAVAEIANFFIANIGSYNSISAEGDSTGITSISPMFTKLVDSMRVRRLRSI